MHDRIMRPRLLRALVVLVMAPVVVSACGSSNDAGNATKLLQETFTGHHTVNSGDLTVNLTLTPSGSRVLTQPITFTFGGPFQSLGKGKLPQSNFTVTISTLGKGGSLGILSTGTTGYVTLQGTSYELPAATFRQLESSFSQIGGGSGSTNLSGLGIHPLSWLSNPSVVGTENVAGASTTHIRAGLNVTALLGDINKFLHKASTLSSSTQLPTGISSAATTRVANAVKNATVDIWTGSNDKTIRKLAISLSVPVTGQISTELGGLSTAGLGLSVQYANLNQPQTIVAPADVQPYSEFAAKVRTFLQSLQSGVLGGLASTAGGSGAGAASGAGTPADKRYAQCIQAAGGSITKLQACAPLLNGNGK